MHRVELGSKGKYSHGLLVHHEGSLISRAAAVFACMLHLVGGLVALTFMKLVVYTAILWQGMR